MTRVLLLGVLLPLLLRNISSKTYNLISPIDLSHAFDENTINWDKNVSFQLINRVAQQVSDSIFYAKNDFIGAEHGGTHLDAPYHFNKNGWKVADIPLDYLINPGVIIDVSKLVEKFGNDFQLSPGHLIEWEEKYGQVPADVIVLVNFGWSVKYTNRTLYFGSASPPFSFPGISPEAAEWIVSSGRIRGVGVDTPSMDYGKTNTFPTHRILSKANLFGLENVNLHNASLPTKGFDLIVLPMKIKKGTGAPCRIVAV